MEDNRRYHDKWTVNPQRSESTDITVARGHAEAMRLLIEQEGGMQDESGWTALMVATYWNRLECVKPLAEKEKDMKAMHKWYEYPLSITALDIANQMKHTEIVSILSG